MLLKLTCPTCGRSDQASDRVIGKEVRCPCGATFRVVGPKQGNQVHQSARPYRSPGWQRLNTAPAPRQPEIRAKSPSSSRSSDAYAPVSRPERSLPEASRPQATEQHPAGGLPPWVYAAFGGAGVLFLVAVGALVVSLSSSTAPTSRKPAQTDDPLTAQAASQPIQSDEKVPAVEPPPNPKTASLQQRPPGPLPYRPQLPGLRAHRLRLLRLWRGVNPRSRSSREKCPAVPDFLCGMAWWRPTLM